MAAKYWIKLYQEILYDPKMGLMSDRLYRRTIELFLLAGEMDEEGYLPTVEEIAWKLRLEAEQLETEMIELQKVGILSMDGGRWYVTKFAERQAANPPAERMRQFRDREKKREYYEPVTHGVTIRNTDKETEEESDIDAETEEKQKEAAPAAAFSNGDAVATHVYTQVTGHLMIPGPVREKIEAEQTIRQICAAHADPAGYLSPFWEEWQRRQYSPTNTAWLTSWAATGVIPPPRKQAEKPASQRSSGDAFAKTKQVTEEWLRSKNNGQ